jgi:hypothetical protein
MRTSRWLQLPHLDDTFPLPIDGPFSTRDAVRAGVTPRELTLLTKEGLLRAPIKGVHVAAQVPDDTAHRLACLALVTPPDAIVVDRHAGWAQGATMVLHPGEHLQAQPIAIYLPHGRGRLRNKLVESGERTFRDSDLTVVGGMRMTTPLRTALDLGRQRWPEPALTALDALHRLGAFSVEELLSEVGRFHGMRWVRTLRQVAPHTDGRSQSGGETVVRWRWKHLPVPPPEPQVEVRCDGRLAFVDVGNAGLRFGIEFQGLEWHTGEREKDDETRFAWLHDDADWILEPVWTADVYSRGSRLDEIIFEGVRRARRRHGA